MQVYIPCDGAVSVAQCLEAMAVDADAKIAQAQARSGSQSGETGNDEGLVVSRQTTVDRTTQLQNRAGAQNVRK